MSAGSIDSPIALDVLIAINTFQPIQNDAIAELLSAQIEDVGEAVRQLEARGFIHGRVGKNLFATLEGRKAVDRAGSRDLRDVGRLLYLWRRQQGETR